MNKIFLYIILSFIFTQDPDWDVDLTLYEFSANIAAGTITVDGEVKSTGQLAAFVGDSSDTDFDINGNEFSTYLRGVDPNGGLLFPPTGDYLWEVTIGLLSAADVSFKYYDDINDTIIDLDQTILISPSDILGNAIYGTFDLTANTTDCGNDFDEDGICDDVDDCVGEYDECGICNGDGIDEDEDQICDDVDDCVGEYDECDICNGTGPFYECLDGSFVCHSSDCTNSFPVPDLFDFVESTSSAWYYITNVYINGLNLDSDDWVGAFNGDVCVGARKWDTAECQNGVCDIKLQGVNTLDDDTEGYMQYGDIPSFKIYDASENIYYNAIASDNYEWESGSLFVIDNLNEADYFCQDTPSCSGCLDNTACNYNPDALIADTCYYMNIDLLEPSDNQIIELDELPGGSLTFSWSEIHESCIENASYEFRILNQSFDLILLEEVNGATIDIPYDSLNISIDQFNFYSWFVTGSNFFATSDTYYFMIDATAMSSDNYINYSFDLFDNYPNPFNPITEIRFNVPYYSFVDITIYDIFGNFVEKLSKTYYPSGLHKVYWDASNFSSGIYIYEMKSDNYFLSKKMMLVK